MKLKRLRVKGLRSFSRETEIDLGRLGELGLFAITGPTGAGKSTILDGIFLALFGKSPRGEPSECVSVGATELAVRLELEADGLHASQIIGVERRFRWAKRRGEGEERGAAKHAPLRIEVEHDGAWEPVDLRGKRADDYLREEIVRVSMRDFQQAVVLPQGEFDALLRARPAERRALVASLFRTEHLGQPLVELVKQREGAARGEVSGLEEAEREVFVGEAELVASVALATATASHLREAEQALVAATDRAARQLAALARCRARDAAARVDADATAAVAARAEDATRAGEARRARGAEGPLAELEHAEAEHTEAMGRATELDVEAKAAEARRRAASTALAAAAGERATLLPDVLEKLGWARVAEEREEALPAARAERTRLQRAFQIAHDAAQKAEIVARETASALARAEEDLRARSETLATTRVGEDERTWAVAVALVVEHRLAEERAERLAVEELASVKARVGAVAAELVTREAHAARLFAGAALVEAERERLRVDAERAATEVERAEADLVGTRRAESAADLMTALRDGEPCLVCGSREHPGVDRTATLVVDLAERNVAATKRVARAAEDLFLEATRRANAAAEEARAASGRAEATLVDLDGVRELAEQTASGAVVPRAVLEARAVRERLALRVDVAFASVAVDRREAVRERGERESLEDAEVRLADLARRARLAEGLERKIAEVARSRDGLGAKLAELRSNAERTARDRAVAEAGASAATAQLEARTEEVAVLLRRLFPRGQASLFDRPRERTAAEWVRDLDRRASELSSSEETARVAFDEARGIAEQLALEAREAQARRREVAARLARAKAVADAAVTKAGFADLDSLRRASLDPATLEDLEKELARLAEEQRRAATVLAERRRDVDREVSAEEAGAAEDELTRARNAASAARTAAAEATARGHELTRRRARSLELRASIDALLPRVERLARIRQIVASGQLSELAAERHLEAVTAAGAALLQTLSSNRYTLVRDAQGAFAVGDAAHGGLVRAPSTLSGGETFLVSLALALSLSERIQLAGRTRFDFFFLDEGFGSLDAGTLDVALGALEQLRGPNRVIGMISHVPTIAERMPRRLRVSASRRGGAAAVEHDQ